MSRKIILIIILTIFLILLFPIPKHLKDGGTIEYNSLSYNIIKVHKLDSETLSGYTDGLIIKIFGHEIYNNVPLKIENEKITKEIDNLNLELNILNDWNFKELSLENYKYAIKFYKSDSDNSAILYVDNSLFGVCGTGRTISPLKLNNGSEISIGSYDKTTWHDITFIGISNVFILNHNLTSDETNEFLDMLKTWSITNNN